LPEVIVVLSVNGDGNLGVGLSGSAVSRAGEWVVTLDLDGPVDPSSGFQGELAVRALAVAVAGSRSYVESRPSGYSFTVIVGTTGTTSLIAALSRALSLLAEAQRKAGLAESAVVCAEVTLLGSRPVPAGRVAAEGCENPGS
jgi:hypothetical protein